MNITRGLAAMTMIAVGAPASAAGRSILKDRARSSPL